MTEDRCARSWQVEPFADRRLEPNDRASFERHLEICADCARELRELEQLNAAMTETPSFERSELERRRARARLLSAASQSAPERSPVRWLAFASVAVALALTVFFLRRPATPGFQVADLGHAQWHVDEQGGVTRVALSAGSAGFHVERVAPRARFLVVLPDGELEVRGTRFVVDVEAAHTRSVAVSEGVVALRLAGGEQILRAGEHWVRPTPEQTPAPMPAGPVAANEVSAAPSVSAASAEASGRSFAGALAPSSALAASTAPTPERARREPSATPVSSETASVPLVASQTAAPTDAKAIATPPVASETAGTRFAAAVAAFGAGDYGRADALLAAFTRDFPRDARAEDAAFLRADARARRGDRAGAAAAAREYLQRYPHGLREPEAQRLSHLAD